MSESPEFRSRRSPSRAIESSTTLRVGGVRLDALAEPETEAAVTRWARAHGEGTRTVCFVNAWSIVSAQRDAAFRAAINDSHLSVVDGVPVAWLGRHLTGGPCDRLSGPDLMHRLLTSPEHTALRHFVYGGSQDSLDRLEFRYNRGGVSGPRRIVGTYSPPFRALTPEEEQAFVDRISSLRPHLLWVCLGTASQEKWMARMRTRLDVPVMLGVGAAVDFLSGAKPRAPRWLQRAGLEWLFRLVTEPRRLWRRYLVGNLQFLRIALAELLRRRPAAREQS